MSEINIPLLPPENFTKEEKEKIYRQRWYQKHKSKISQKNKDRYNSDPAYKAAIHTRSKKYHCKHRKKLCAYHREYYQNNKEKMKLWGIKRRQRDLLPAFGSKCARCGYSEFPESLDIHHIEGRKQNPNLVMVLCRNCHQALHNKKWKLEELTLQSQLQ